VSNTKMIVEAIEKTEYDDFDIGDQCCCLCGTKKSFKWTAREKILSSSFTDWNVMKDKNSQYICGYCEKLLSDSYIKTGNHDDKGREKTAGLRCYSFLVEDGQITFISSKEKEKYLFEHFYKTPYILAFTDSRKKHISWKAAIGGSNTTITINTENGKYSLNRNK